MATERSGIEAIGLTNTGRQVFVALTYRDGSIRPVSARFMHERDPNYEG